MEIRKIALIGAGNTASYLLKSIPNSVAELSGYARHPKPGFKELKYYHQEAEKFQLTLLCVPDSAIREVSQQLPAFNGIMAHVSGVSNMSLIAGLHRSKGILYPLMSMTSTTETDISQIPFCIEASSPESLAQLENFVARLGATAHHLNSHQREIVHLGAVISQNFSNHLYHLASKVLSEQDLNWKLLLPLLEQSLSRLHTGAAYDFQTGPAIRKDEATLKRHLALLTDPKHKEIYHILSQSIQSEHDQKL